MTLVKIIRPGDVAETGPISIEFGAISIINLEPLDTAKEMFGGHDRVTMIGIAVSVENTSDNTVSFHPNQGTIVTNTKEQQAADLFISENVGGEFIGQVVKEGKVLFTLESSPEEITSITYVIEPPFNSDPFEQVGDKLTFEFEFE